MLILKEEFEVIGDYGKYKAEYKTAMTALASSNIPFADKLVITNNGFYDLEKKGLVGKGFWIGYEHDSVTKANKRAMYSSVEDAAYLLNKVLFKGKGVVEDFWSSSDMFRIYMVY